MSTINKTIALLSIEEKRSAVHILILSIGLALFEAIGVASIMPFLAVLGSPNLINDNETLSYIYQMTLHINTHHIYE